MTSGLHSENSLETFQRKELRRIKEEVFKRKAPPLVSRMKSVDMQTEEAKASVGTIETYETPRRHPQAHSIESTGGDFPTLTKLEPRMEQ